MKVLHTGPYLNSEVLRLVLCKQVIWWFFFQKWRFVLKTDLEFESISGFHICTIAEDANTIKPGTIKLNS